MSGGHFDYSNDNLCHEIFGWEVSADYGECGFKQSKIARNNKAKQPSKHVARRNSHV